MTKAKAEWAEVIELANKPPDQTHEMVEDVVECPIETEDKVRIAQENADDDALLISLEAEVDEIKEQLKEKKNELSVIQARIRERNREFRSGVVKRTGKWVVDESFSTNTLRYLDPKTGKVVFERAMTPEERQTGFDFNAAEARAKSSTETSQALPEDRDSTTNMTEDPDQTDINGLALLEGEPPPPEVQEPPAIPVRRRKRVAVAATEG